MSEEKVIVFTHGIDIDGYGCAALAKLAYKNPIIVYAGYNDIDKLFDEYWQSGQLYKYDKVFITDICIGMEECKKVDSDKRLLNKIAVFDHHESCLGKQSQFPWVKLEIERDDKTSCGTSLFYQYLVSQGLLKVTPASEQFVEFTRIQDTDWKNPNFAEAHMLDTLSMAIGREKYVESMVEKLNKPVFELTKKDKQAIKKYLEEYNKQLQIYFDAIQVIDFEGNKAGYVEILNIFRSNIAKVVQDSPLAETLELLIMPILDDNKVSFRAISPTCDVAKVAEKFGGGGHPYAASCAKQNFQLNIKSGDENQ